MATGRVLNFKQARRNLKSVMETPYLTRSSHNGARLREAIAEIDRGDVVRVEIVDGEVKERPRDG